MLPASKMPLAELPPRDSRFGSPLQLSRAHWVRPEVVVEVTYLTWTDNLLRQVSYQGEREDKPARQVAGCGASASEIDTRLPSLFPRLRPPRGPAFPAVRARRKRSGVL